MKDECERGGKQSKSTLGTGTQFRGWGEDKCGWNEGGGSLCKKPGSFSPEVVRVGNKQNQRGGGADPFMFVFAKITGRGENT